MPWDFIALTKPRLLITVATTVLLASVLRVAHREREHGEYRLVAVDGAGVVDRQAAVGVAVEGEADVGTAPRAPP